MIFQLRSAYPGDIRNELKSADLFCQVRKREIVAPKYQSPSCHANGLIHETEPNRRKILERWPMAISSRRIQVVQE